MPIMFNTLLEEANITPLPKVRLLRHKDQKAKKGYTPYELWRDQKEQFELYQSTQNITNHEKLNARYWASFVGTPLDETLFVGLYEVRYKGRLKTDTEIPTRPGSFDKAESCDVWDLTLLPALSDFIGKMYINWGLGTRAFIQRADNGKHKPITELRKTLDREDFPGLLNFTEPLSKFDLFPQSWRNVLLNARGVYVLTCPRTKEQYVGSAYGEENFWGRLKEYIRTGNGGNVVLRSRDPSDYLVSILEVAGSSAQREDILKMESRWKEKLQSRVIGLNSN